MPIDLDCNLPATWQQLGIGVGVYVRLPGTEPVFLAGLGRATTVADVEGAIKFLGVIRDTIARQ